MKQSDLFSTLAWCKLCASNDGFGCGRNGGVRMRGLPLRDDATQRETTAGCPGPRDPVNFTIAPGRALGENAHTDVLARLFLK